MQTIQVVLASGEIVNANKDSHSDLFQALKGGTNNFGIVTNSKLKAFEQGNLWGGVVGYPSSTAAQQDEGFVHFVDGISKDPYNSLISYRTFNATSNQSVILNFYESTRAEPYAAAFKELTSIKPELFNSMRITNLTDIGHEIESPYNAR